MCSRGMSAKDTVLIAVNSMDLHRPPAQRSFTRGILNAGNDRNAAGAIAKLEAIRFMIADDFGKKRGMIAADPQHTGQGSIATEDFHASNDEREGLRGTSLLAEIRKLGRKP